MNDVERSIKDMLATRASEAASGPSGIPQATLRRARMRRLTTIGSAVVIAGLMSVGVATQLPRNEERALPPVGPSPTASSTEAERTATSSPQTIPPTTAFPASLLVVKNRNLGAMIDAHGGFWVDAGDHRSAQELLRFGYDGKLTRKIDLTALLPGFRWSGHQSRVAADATGLWVHGLSATSNSTSPTGGCRAVERSGSELQGEDVLMRLHARSGCPTLLVEIGTPQNDPHVRSLTATGTSLWISTAQGLWRIDATSGEVMLVRDDVTGTVKAAFGSLWAAAPDEEKLVLRLNADDGSTIAEIDAGTAVTAFGFGEGSIWAAGTVASGLSWHQRVVRIDAVSNRVLATLEGRPPESGPFVMIARDGYLFTGSEPTLERFNVRTGRSVGYVHVHEPRTDADAPVRWVMGLAYRDGVLWVTVRERGLYRIDPSRLRWAQQPYR